ncbi:MAG: YlxR family protein [Thermoleophilia bacterium]|nr:YlxR family protein [Thermoleophilia bacterium]
MEPIRTCVGCRTRAPRAELVRFVARAGTLTADPTGRAPGRGAYTCRRGACFERAVARRAFARALRQRVEIPSGLAPEG